MPYGISHRGRSVGMTHERLTMLCQMAADAGDAVMATDCAHLAALLLESGDGALTADLLLAVPTAVPAYERVQKKLRPT